MSALDSLMLPHYVGRMVRTLVVGMANRGNKWAGEIDAHPAFQLLGVADVNGEVLAEKGDEHGIAPEHRHISYREAVASGQYDVAVIATPNHFHYPVAKGVLSAGLHCLVEKPFAETMEHAEELVALAEENKRALLVGQNYRYKAMIRLMTAAIRDEKLGRLSGIEASFHRYRPPRYSHEVIMPFPMLYLQAIHHLDWLLSILPSPIKRVFSRHRRLPWSAFDSPSICHVMLECKDGMLENYRGSYESRGEITPYDGQWRIECEKGDLIVDNKQSLWQVTKDGNRKQRLYRPRDGERAAESILLDDFLASVQDGSEAPVSGRRNLATLRLLFDVIAAGSEV